MTLNEYNKNLHDLIRGLIDIEMAILNGKYETAYYLLGRINVGPLLVEMRAKVRDKLFEIHGEK